MTPQMRTILVILAFIALGYLWMSRSGAGSDVPAAAGAARGGEAQAKSSKKAGGIQASDIPVIIRSESKPHPGEVFARERTLFDYAQSPDEIAAIEEARRLLAEQQQREAAERKVRDDALRVVQEEQARERALREAKELADRQAHLLLHPPKPVPPQFPYEYIGIIGPKDDAHAILRGGGNKLTYAQAGDVIDGKFHIERVAKFVLDLTYTDTQFAGEINQVQRTFEGASAGAAAGAPPRR